MAFSRRFARFALTAAVLGSAFALNACVEQSSYEQLDTVQPKGPAFAQALFKDYAYIARSFGTSAGTAGTTFDADNSIALTDYTSDVTQLANAFADKAIVAGRGEEVIVEPAPEEDTAAQIVRMRVLKDIDAGRDKAPEDAARVQTDYDCWIMNARVDSQKSASVRCQGALNNDLAKLESQVNVAAAAAPDASASPDASAAPDSSAAPASAPDAPTTPVAQAPAPATAPASAPAPAAAPVAAPVVQSAPPPTAPAGPQYTVYFAPGSPVLTSEDVAVIQHAIDDARQSGAGHIVVIGHADTAEGRGQALSDSRAGAVRDVMMQMGARYESIQVSGTGDKDLAVSTRRGVKEPRNRRAVIVLTP